MSAYGESPEDTVEILNIVPMRGPLAIAVPSSDNAISLATEEINSGTGILGREIRVTNIDGGRAPEQVATEISALLATGMVHAITGWHTSAVRMAVAEAGGGRVPYIYAACHEGLPTPTGVLMLGEHPAEHTLAAVSWARRELGVQRWAIIGADYIWPRELAKAIRGAAAEFGEVVLERFTAPGVADFSDFLEHRDLDRADGVLIMLLGADAAAFNRQFAASGRDGTQVRIGPSIDENVLLAGGPTAHHNLYVPSSFFVGRCHENDLRARYRRRFGSFSPGLTTFSNAGYEALHTLREVAEIAGSLEVPAIERIVHEKAAFDAPDGPCFFRGRQAVRPSRLARVEGVDFEIVDTLHGVGLRR
ncbi:substrate-binding domain-containing protein [Nocardia higoensis]|uniref:Substrate-binding domain-containing protein n=1 Tax=Nocardia higoensis TaxID=228599 RepID=A0ABS0DBU2_9NOCA|nr:substrate-binding domain-containing protein [Nocardia higoensis]MBF6355935.1 substrate-binding domain-containing protein [Nocardia higoensis]